MQHVSTLKAHRQPKIFFIKHTKLRNREEEVCVKIIALFM